MFVSAKQLVKDYGIDDEIARFFVDREPPANNLYWYEKLLYLRPAPGYLFIPLIVDLLYKLGIDKQQLLSDQFIVIMEDIGHITALEETKKITGKQAVEQCTGLVKDVCKSKVWYNSVARYLSGGHDTFFSKLSTPFPALHRGDIFLFSISVLSFDDALFEKIAEQWFALISTLLLLDDAEDIETDKGTGDENAFIQSGLNCAGTTRLNNLVEQNIQQLKVVNPALSAQLQKQYNRRIQMPDILKLINGV